MSLREEQCKKVCRILDDVLANRPTERDSLIVAVQLAFKALSEPHWIPVTEEPIPDGEYLVTWTSEIQEKPILSIICRYSGVWDCWELQLLGHQDINVLAYMELPEAYKPTVPPECEGDCGWCKPSVIEKCKGATK